MQMIMLCNSFFFFLIKFPQNARTSPNVLYSISNEHVIISVLAFFHSLFKTYDEKKTAGEN